MEEYRESKTEAARFRCAFFLVARFARSSAARKLRASPCARGCSLLFLSRHPTRPESRTATSLLFLIVRTDATLRLCLAYLSYLRPGQVLSTLHGGLALPCAADHATPCHGIPHCTPRHVTSRHAAPSPHLGLPRFVLIAQSWPALARVHLQSRKAAHASFRSCSLSSTCGSLSLLFHRTFYT